MACSSLRAITDNDERATIVSIDGVGAYDHVSRARIFEELWRVESLHSLVPYVRMFLAISRTLCGVMTLIAITS